MTLSLRTTPALITLLATLATVVAPLSACNSFGSACSFDSDCDADQLCVRDSCLKTCTADQDCLDDNDDKRGSSQDEQERITCQTHAESDRAEPVSVCAPDGYFDDTNTTADCETSEQCRAQLNNPLARCSLAKTCFLPSDEHAILITDTSTTSTRGVQLLQLYLLDERQQIVGYGVTATVTPAPQEPNAKLLDGQPPQLDATAQCTTASSPYMVPLGGAGGRARHTFVDAAGRRLLLKQGWQVVAVENGSNCQQPAPFAEYSVALCVSSSGQSIDIERDCSTILGQSLSGYNALAVPALP